MKKIDRLRWVEKNFGKQFVLKYFFCRNWDEIKKAIEYFESKKQGWGMRTDTLEGYFQKDNCPFLFKGLNEDALRIWSVNKNNLYYIICENILMVLCHGVAYRIDDEHIVIEFNDKNRDISLRDMYNFPDNLRRIGIGPNRYIIFPGSFKMIIRCFHPEETMIYSFDIVYDLMISLKVKEIEFTVKTDRQIIIW